jgi:hypothetical protein
MAAPHRYGGRHQKLRESLLRSYVPGVTLCWRCRMPINETDTSRVHLGHLDGGRGYGGLEHLACNIAASNGGKPRTAPRRADPEPGPAWTVRPVSTICDQGCKYVGRADQLHPPGRCGW